MDGTLLVVAAVPPPAHLPVTKVHYHPQCTHGKTQEKAAFPRRQSGSARARIQTQAGQCGNELLFLLSGACREGRGRCELGGIGVGRCQLLQSQAEEDRRVEGHRTANRNGPWPSTPHAAAKELRTQGSSRQQLEREEASSLPQGRGLGRKWGPRI